MDWIFFFIVMAIVAIIAALAILGQRSKPGKRGSDPGTGHHILHSDYQSGVGGGNVKTWKVPRSPKEYAKFFVPKAK
ncbi:MAG: hypothetical protein AAGF53_09475 [Pseudomonadota bacterium]